MKKALVIGIDYYKNFDDLQGCVKDAHDVASVLARNGDGSINVDVKLLTGTGPGNEVIKKELRENIAELFYGKGELAIFYFSGHGSTNGKNGFLISSEIEDPNDGFPLQELMNYVNDSEILNTVIILDSCFSGAAAAHPNYPDFAEIREGTTILTASKRDQLAAEEHGAGVFTTLLVDALQGGAANLVGKITPGSVYAHIDQSLGDWRQRPVFKTNVERFVSLREVKPPIELDDLRKIIKFFPMAGFEFQLDPTYEPEEKGRDEGMPPPDPLHVEIFTVLQKFNRINLLVPVDAPHMWHAAMQSKTCKLTVLGEHYRRLVEEERI